MAGVAQKDTPKERIRGFHLSEFIKVSSGVSFKEGLMRAEAENRVMASSSRLSRAMIGSDEWKGIGEVFPCCSGTNTTYVEPNRRFEDAVIAINDLEKVAGTRYFIEYVGPFDSQGKRYLFPVHPDHLDKQNSILVAEHPNYTLHQDGNDIITIPAGMSLKEAVALVGNFPPEDGWYKGDPKHDIPTEKKIEFSDTARYLIRIGKRVGPVVRAFGDVYVRRVVVLVDGRPRVGLGVAVEASDSNEQSSLRPLTEGQSGAGASLEHASSSELTVLRQGDGKLIVRGSPQQIEAAARLLEQLKQ